MLRDKISFFFSGVMLLATGFFLVWAFEHTGARHPALLILATLFGLFMAFNIGGNDVANSFGTSVGAGTLTIRQALVVAAVFEVSGAMIAGGAVTDTIRKGIVDLGTLTEHPSFNPLDFVFVMMASLLAAALWLLLATKKGWPVSTTHSIVGGIVGGSVALGASISGAGEALGLVQWDKVGSIAASWVLSPLLGGLVSYLLFSQIKRFILSYNDQAQRALEDISERLASLDADNVEARTSLEQKRTELNPHRALVVFSPLLAALASMVMTAMLLYKGLHNLELELTEAHRLTIISMTAVAVWMGVYLFAKSLRSRTLERSTFLLFSWMQVFTAAGFAFSHGSNDIANAIGPFAAVLDVFHNGHINATSPVPPAAMFTFGVALVAGLWFIGKEVIATVGTHLTKMHPASGFSAEIAAAGVVLLASAFGIPVSSTHILVGAVLGIGLANRSTNWDLMRPIGLAWVITLPASAAMSAIGFVLLRSIF